MVKSIENMASYAELDKAIKDFNRISFLLPLKVRDQLRELEESFKKLKYQIDNFNKRFSDSGWIAYDSLNSQVIEKLMNCMKQKDYLKLRNI